QQMVRGLDLAAGFAERSLAVHHPRAGPFAELLHQCCGDLGHWKILDRQKVVYGMRARSEIAPTPVAVVEAGRATGAPGARRHSATKLFACAIQPSIRPGRPTSSPTRCASSGPSSAICQ